MNSDLLEVGIAGRPHGIKGEVSAVWLANISPQPNTSLFIGKDIDNLEDYKVISSRFHKNKLLLLLDKIQNRTQAEALNGSKIFISREQLAPLEQGEAYLADIQGSKVFLIDGTEIGYLDHFEFPAGQEIWVIRSQKGAEILFPARSEFIDSLDVKHKRIIIDPPKGLLDIYSA